MTGVVESEEEDVCTHTHTGLKAACEMSVEGKFSLG